MNKKIIIISICITAVILAATTITVNWSSILNYPHIQKEKIIKTYNTNTKIFSELSDYLQSVNAYTEL